MREIKFDVILWDGKDPKTIEHYNIEEALMEGYIDFSGGVMKPVDDSIIIRQYTERKSIDAVDVYDGDIIQYTSRRKQEVGIVSWGLDGWWIWNIKGYWECQSRIKLYSTLIGGQGMVIGNRWSNPELLGVKK